MADAILVTGGAGFIGSNFILEWIRDASSPVINLDRLTYAGNPSNLDEFAGDPRYTLVEDDICNGQLVSELLFRFRPRAIIHFAAESHVDRSIAAPGEFLRTNVQGTFELLQCAYDYWRSLDPGAQSRFRFLHVSTDEVYGSLAADGSAFCETTPYAPSSPYAASKAASDHLVRAWNRTYGLPTLIANCSNNYGPFQFPEKLIPLMILNALDFKPLPVYGDGGNVRDWLYVSDHCAALRTVLERGLPGESYSIGGGNQWENIEVVKAICDIVDELRPDLLRGSRRDLIAFVKDRPGHDRRYSVDCSKIERELGWRPTERFLAGLRKTIQWYLDHPAWVQNVISGSYKDWIRDHYRGRGRD